jgi:hypothetical protein
MSALRFLPLFSLVALPTPLAGGVPAQRQVPPEAPTAPAALDPDSPDQNGISSSISS